MFDRPTDKTRMIGLPYGKKWQYVKTFSSNPGTSRTDRQTDGQTDRIAISISRVRLDSRTLPLELRHHCTSSVLSTCLRNDVLASCLLTKHSTHPRWRDSYTCPTIWSIDMPHLQWPWTIRFQGNASMLNIVIFINHTWRQTNLMQIYGKKLQNKSKKEISVINGMPSR